MSARDEVGLHLAWGGLMERPAAAATRTRRRRVGQAIPSGAPAAEPARHPPEQPVTGGVAQESLDGLEVVEIDEQQGADEVLTARLRTPGQGLVQLAAIGQAGQPSQ